MEKKNSIQFKKLIGLLNKILLNPLLIVYDEICVSPRGTNSCSY